MARTESEVLWTYRDGHQNLHVSTSRPVGVESTEYRMVKKHEAKAPKEAPPARVVKKKTVPRLLDRSKSPAVKKGR